MTEQRYVLKESEVRLKLAEGRSLYSPVPLSTPDDAVQTMAALMKEYDREVACVVNLDNKLRPINFSVVGMGNQHTCPIAISSIFKSALLSGAGSILLLHNHPSGDITPSSEDLEITKKMIMAGNLLEVPLTDHIIVGGYTGEWCSIRSDHPEIDFNAAPVAVAEPEPERVRRKSR